MLNIFYGRENLDKEKFIYDNIRGRALLVVPDQFTLEAERELIAHSGAKALMDVEVLSLSRLGYRLLEELGGSKRTFIDKYGRHMILSSIAAEEREKLQVFKGLEEKNSFIELVNNFISEMKQFNCGADELAEIARSVPDGSYTQRKLEDLYLLYSEYEAAIRGKYTDSEDYIDLFLGKISRSELVAGNHIWIYGFDSFAPKALSVIGELMQYAADVNLVLTYDDKREARDADLFALAETVIRNFENLAERRSIEVRKRAIPKTYTAERADKIQFIEQELYALPARKYARGGQSTNPAEGGASEAAAAGTDSLTLVAAANLYNEAESAACYVLELVRDFGYRFSDIKVICNDQETRGPILKRVFKEYGIDLVSDTSKDILQSSIVQYITALMDVVVEKYRTDLMIKMLKSGFGDLTNDEITDLENYAIKYKIRGTMWKRPFVRGESEYEAEALVRMNAVREKALAFMPDLEAIFEAETCGEFISGLYGFLYEKAKLPEKIADLTVLQTEQGRPDLAEETAQIWGKVIGIFDQMSEIMGEQKFRAAAFRDLFEVGISQVEIGILPPTKDGLMMGTMQRTRTGEMKALVVVGANEGVLPNEKPGSGLFGSDEKNLFKENGIELCKVDDVRFLEERMGIYRNLSKPRERLWISYSLSDAEGGPARPSGVFTKLAGLFGDTPVARDALNRQTDAELVGAGPAGLRHLTEALQAACEGKPLAPHWHEALTWFKQNKPEALEPIRAGIAFTNKQEDLGREMTAALYMGNIESTREEALEPSPELSLSPSRLERYARCPFSHFVQYGLKPEERRIFEIAPREIGDIYHECLMEMSRHLTARGIAITDPASPWMTISREECRTFVEDVIAKKSGTYREGILEAGNEEKYRGRRITDICEKVCWAVIEQVRAGEILRSSFEAPFGRGRRIPPIPVNLGEGRTAYIEGKIDRVDYLPGERVKIIDYKTGNENFSVAEAEAGYRLQLMLYLEASLERRMKPAGVFYFKISEPMVDASGAAIGPEEISDKIQKSFKLNGVIVDDPNVIRNVAGDFSGISDVVPIRINKEGLISGTGKDNLLTDEEFESLREKVCEKVTDICKSLAGGGIEIHPMKTAATSACAYCRYKGICRFDTIFEGCSYNII
ncbi:putative uncharacterized protein [Firmicutes bacterium CAG:238]|nr:putative uncharacterized protein [Firmicutes bacterium CAG:238]